MVQSIPTLIAAICVLGLPRVRPAQDRAKALSPLMPGTTHLSSQE